jgi:hypothetical protein
MQIWAEFPPYSWRIDICTINYNCNNNKNSMSIVFNSFKAAVNFMSMSCLGYRQILPDITDTYFVNIVQMD